MNETPEQIGAWIKSFYGADKLADHEVFPKVFNHQVKVALYYKAQGYQLPTTEGPPDAEQVVIE